MYVFLPDTPGALALSLPVLFRGTFLGRPKLRLAVSASFEALAGTPLCAVVWCFLGRPALRRRTTVVGSRFMVA
jgi:hypothetical protein